MQTVNPSPSFPALERETLSFWNEHKTFEKSLELRKNSKPYMFYDGPPFATGTPHYGHLLAGTIKDIIPRYQTMRGRFVERRFGWDTHGLPIEMIVEKDLGLKGRSDILNYGVAKFNEACRAGVLTYVKEWERVTGRLGRWIDFVNDYKTMDVWFMDSVWWVFKQLWDKGRVYQGTRVMPYSWRLATPLSNFEASSNYKDVQDPALTVRFKLIDKPGVSLLAWTTTPWTLPSNLGICAHPEIEYVHIRVKGGEELVLAEARLGAYFKKKDDYEIVAKLKGQDLAGWRYQPLFPYFAGHAEQGAFRVLLDPYVTAEDGTGLVHLTSSFGEDDHRVIKKHGIPMADPIDAEGNFTAKVPELAGKNIKDAEKEVARMLKDAGLLFKQDTLVHSYPFCERSDTPLIYKTLTGWYVKVEDIRDRMLANNATIHWVPEHIKDGRFGKWLEGARDWNISRNRFWGNPIPIWICEQCGEKECLSSRADLESKVGKQVPDLHKHFVDELHWQCAKCSGQMTRTPEVLDCWFESGSMPYAQLHYPFENKERFEQSFPADFIAEGLDQTRGWFYTLMVLSSSLFEKAPFKNCVVNGIILAEDGKKMSKRLKNYPDPLEIVEQYGADALRLFMINSPAVRGENLRFSENGVREIVRSVLLPFWNVYSFFTTYANIDKFTPRGVQREMPNALDRWIISRFQTLLSNIEREMGQYHLYQVVPVLLEFIEELTNWYVRRSRRRFWSDDKADKQNGYDTLYYILAGFSRALAPFLPFVTESIYRNLATLNPKLGESVHLNDYPLSDSSLVDAQLESDMALIQKAVGLGRALRARADLKVRQPLASITVVTRNESDAAVLKRQEAHIQEELNVKSVLFSAHEEQFVDITVKPNFPLLGPIFGKEMGKAAGQIGKFGWAEVYALEDGKKINVAGKEVDLQAVEVRRAAKAGHDVETGSGIAVFYDTKLTPELVAEGQAREFVNRVQRMRKDANFEVTDRIAVKVESGPELKQALGSFVEYIKEEVLAVEFAFAAPAGELVQKHDIDAAELTVGIARVG